MHGRVCCVIAFKLNIRNFPHFDIYSTARRIYHYWQLNESFNDNYCIVQSYLNEPCSVSRATIADPINPISFISKHLIHLSYPNNNH